MAVKVQTRFHTEAHNGSPCGSKRMNTYRMVIDDTGHKSLVPDGSIDIYEGIQSYKEEVDIHNIIARCMAGDDSALMQRIGQYMDVTEAPKTLAEAQNMIIEIQQQFKQLPVDIRAKFDHSVEKYIATFNSTEWREIMKIDEAASPAAADPSTGTTE